MRRIHRNEIFKIIQDSGIGIDRFLIEDDINGEIFYTRISLIDSPFNFVVCISNESYNAFDYSYTLYAPNYPSSEHFPPNDFCGFEEIADNLKWWLNSVVATYIEDKVVPDLWEEYKRGSKSLDINVVDFDDKRSFDFDEKVNVRLALEELKFLIQNTLSTNEQEQSIVNARLDYLIEAVDRLNVFDWKSIAVSSLVSISIALSLDTQKGLLLFDLFKKVFAFVPKLIP